jgi:hypothetical protein
MLSYTLVVLVLLQLVLVNDAMFEFQRVALAPVIAVSTSKSLAGMLLMLSLNRFDSATNSARIPWLVRCWWA